MPYKITRLANKKFQQPQMEGDGLYDIASSLWSPSTSEPPQLREFLKEHGGETITKIIVRRQPLSSLINNLIMWLSLGEITRKIRESPYDKLYHLSLYIETDNETKFVIEKNERINVIQPATSNEYAETIPVRIIRKITVNELIENTKQMMGGTFYPYNAINNNCQVFVSSVLKANKLLIPITSQFINQDVETIFNTSSVLKKIMEYVIYITYVKNVVIQGGDIES